MSVIEIILIGVALAMDASALTIANCATYKKTLTRKKELSMPVAFAAFQFLMPVIGYYVGSLFYQYISKAFGYISSAIFFVLAIKIIYDNVTKILQEKQEKEQAEENQEKNFTALVLLIQAVATSIDALAIGVTFAGSLRFSIFLAAAIIGGVTLIIAAIALIFGKYLGKLFGKYADWVGALILFALAIKNLLQTIGA